MFNISKYIPPFKAFSFRSINKVRTSCGLNALPDYKLISIVTNADIAKLEKEQYWRSAKDATCYDYILIGKKSDPNYTKEVLTCYNKDGKVISRCYRENGVNTRLRLYSYDENTRTIKDSSFDTSRICDEWKKPQMMNICGRWNINYTEIQWIEKFKTFLDKKITRLLTKRIQPINENTEHFIFRQFPLNLGFGDNESAKIFSTNITKTKAGYEISNPEQTDNLHLNFDDKFLPFRIINPRSEEGIIALTKYYLKDLGLDIFNIGIFPNSQNVAKNSSAHFSNSRREICYSPTVTKKYILNLINTVRHEVEHAWQHSLIGRIGKGNSSYETEALQKLGFLKNADESEEAVKLAIAKEKYPTLTNDEDLSKNIEYKSNYMEIQARNAGKRAEEEYIEAEENFDFFEQFQQA